MNVKNEKQLIVGSVLGALGFAVTGMILGTILDSQMIIFDGLYSFISLGLSMLSLWALGKVRKKEKIRLSLFGREKNMNVDTLVVFIKYTVILILVTGSLLTAVTALFDGGRETSMNYALIYAVISTIACYGVYVLLRNPSKKTHTPLLQAEAHQWLMDTWASLGVLVGFALGFILSLIPATAFLVPYMDPFMVVVVSVYFIRIPVKEIQKNFSQLQKG
ncbi:cation transporter [Isachenkonia alkalipeptolytica]|uniref:Cation efflux protein transmembrane domain-containing protein n=1 Tax=Isachenkonia alkalipeptolytica TaxID=2565777 RepID=A0AA43XPB0_9CLOT|nr:cation transporter [Isachenkonia alkalipeptolytica]NBG89315.1 hypothetical protein [Isachenkonia alkalipeptolytica]